MSSLDKIKTRSFNIGWKDNPVVALIFQLDFGKIILMISLNSIINGGKEILVNKRMISEGVKLSKSLREMIGNTESNYNRGEIYYSYFPTGLLSDFYIIDKESLETRRKWQVWILIVNLSVSEKKF